MNAGFEVHFNGKEGWGDSGAIDFRFPDFEFYQDDSLANQVLSPSIKNKNISNKDFPSTGYLVNKKPNLRPSLHHLKHV